MRKYLSVALAALFVGFVGLPAYAEPQPDKAIPAEARDFTSVMSGIIQGFDALTKAADAEAARGQQPVQPQVQQPGSPAGQAFAQTEESFNGVQGQAIDNQKHRSAKTSALIIAGSAGLGASVGKMTGKKNADLIGAIAGGVAGLIYDRLTYKNPHGL